ncbi:bifunctional diaminohydroxyphosphoribosylaminopyrimidine deaminase/5-amino-6-(5-phosphoribosylamino)uracil reductase RibD [Sediminibacillus albus]|uniref:Riboflavin biosynthesis protein RibD n=1 Tax=Sediminibacillus albus TaxID=407036 RepID=A0A1G9AT97_9BACI|nr:bifunctional diaminohydroxyphosphoribosylaminopyrimidine deaminase/5-amino-6-(5-phosphoribosylamino)uracil reductase RibD [Sediminibacillus albus]SDK29850.1 diaminohydroxyphosphoribosylaminopyrimidine deaminase / 5-amino-6-(5-phosphoribosylamino)uracil reductase [Sediminibacillus albus]
MSSKAKYMDTALAIAEVTLGQTSPNPSVGAVVVKDGKVLGIGSHLQAGTEHAEVHALKQAGDLAEGADIYVTLEPCSHHGKTPPCADLIIERKLARVFVACLDPNPEIAGRGVDKLRQAGITVEVGLREERARELNRKFFKHIRHKRPYVTLKAAATLDGKTATASGDSRWITSSEAREDVHKQRDLHDAILVGIGTVLQDDPLLTARLPQGSKNPIRIVLDTHLRIPEDSKLLNSQEAMTWVICGSSANTGQAKCNKSHVKVWQLDTPEIQLEAVLDLLGEQNVQSVYVEGGSGVHGSFVEKSLFDECHWYIAPRLLGGIDAVTSVGGISPRLMKEGKRLTFTSFTQIGTDIKIIAVPDKGEQ